MKTLSLAIGLLLFFQQATPPAEPPRLRHVIATVLDSKDDYVMDLKDTDFVVEEDGAPQRIIGFSQNSPLPISIGFLVDTSGSMNLLFNGVVGAGVVLLRTMKPGDEYMVMTFDKFVNVVEPFTEDRAKVESQLRKIVSGNIGSNIYDAIGYAALNMKAAKNRRRALVVMTDAEDTSDSNINELKRILYDEEIVVFTFGMTEGGVQMPGGFGRGGGTPLPMKVVLDALASASGGRSMTLDTTQMKKDETIIQILKFCQSISAEIRGMYTIGYVTTKPGPAANRVLRVRTKIPDQKVRIRRDVFPDIELEVVAKPPAPAQE